MTPEMFQAVRGWAHILFKIFPVEVYWSEVRSKWMKVPVGTRHGYQDATDRISQLVPMFRSATPRNGGTIGIGCWPGASGYVVMDVDDEDALDALLDEFGRHIIEGAAHVQTVSGGSHYWYRHPGNVEIDNTDIAPGINMRGDNGYVLLPGFAGYELEASSPSLDDVSLRFPDVLLTRIAENKIKASRPGVNPSIGADGKVSRGGRNPFLFSIGSSLKYKGLPYDVIEAVLSLVNDRMCDPPHEPAEVRRAARDAFRSNPVNPSGERPQTSGLDSWVSMARDARGRAA